MKTPRVYDFTDYRAFLQALIEFKRARGEFSYSTFAERAGFKARSYLRTVVTGKRNLSSDALSKIIVGFALNFQEGESFKSLVQFNQATNFEERKYYWENFLKSRPKNLKSQKVQDEYKYLARLFYPILPIILRQNHIKKSIDELARLVEASPKEIKEGLETLSNLGIVHETEPGNYTACATPLNTSNDIPNIAIQTFHSNMLTKAQKALSLHPLEREFQTQILPLSEDELLYLKSRVRALMEEMSEKFDSSRPLSKKVYALNMNLIPVTPEFIRNEGKEPRASQSLVEEDQNKEKIQ